MAGLTISGHLLLAFYVWSSTTPRGIQVSSQFRHDYKFYQEVTGWMKFHKVPATWSDARLKCFYEGAVLASPINERLYSVMRSLMLAKTGAAFTGVQTLTSTGDYFSVEGIHLDEMPVAWAKDEPNNLNNEERCLAIMKDGNLADVKCSIVLPYMCYKEKLGNETIHDCGTSDKEYEREPLTGSCYKYHSDCVDWTRAHMACASEGGTLAIINSEEEAEMLINKYSSRPIKCDTKRHADAARFLYVGFHNPYEDSGYWFTLDGRRIESAGYSKWAPGEPNNRNRPETCGSLTRANEGYNDLKCAHLQPFICEISRVRIPVTGY